MTASPATKAPSPPAGERVGERGDAFLFLLLLLLPLACGPTPPTPTPPDPTHRLGLNDVTWLFPLERLDAGTPFPHAPHILPAASVERLTTALPLVRVDVERLRVVGLRFDRCDRSVPGERCEAAADGIFRVVLQPVLAGSPAVEDVALHAFYPVPSAEVAAVVTELRLLASLQNLPRESPLRPSTGWVSDPRYRERLGALLTKYAASTRMKRLTLFGQQSDRGAVAWTFRGEQLAGTTLAPITIPGIDAGAQEVLLVGPSSYRVTPVVDAPAGFVTALEQAGYGVADAGVQRAALEGLLAVEDPRAHTADTVQCVTCHVSTTLLTARAGDVSAAPRFTAAEFDLSPFGDAAVRARTLRALGWFGDQPLISQRVVNETANVVLELDP